MSMIAGHLEPYLVLSSLLFSIGAFGFLARRNAISMLMSIELMLNAVNLAALAFGAFMPTLAGQGVAFALGKVLGHLDGAVQLQRVQQPSLRVHGVGLLVNGRTLHHQHKALGVAVEHLQSFGRHLVQHGLIGQASVAIIIASIYKNLAA
mgnify:CR=1 FL=1